MPKVSAATLAKEGTRVPGTAIDNEYGNTLYEYGGNVFIVGRNGQVLGWEPGAGSLLTTPRGLLDY
jgi:hypothetical protein